MPIASAGSIFYRRDNASALVSQVVKVRHHQQQMPGLLERGPLCSSLLGGPIIHVVALPWEKPNVDAASLSHSGSGNKSQIHEIPVERMIS